MVKQQKTKRIYVVPQYESYDISIEELLQRAVNIASPNRGTTDVSVPVETDPGAEE